MGQTSLLSNVCWNNINKCVHIKDSTSFCGNELPGSSLAISNVMLSAKLNLVGEAVLDCTYVIGPSPLVWP